MNKRINVTRSSIPSFENYVERIRPLWDSVWLTNMGELHQELENRLKEYLEVENLSLFVNGHMALEMCLQAMNLKGEVITTPFTFASTTHAIVRNGLKPVFCDIREDDYTIDADKIEALINKNTCAILPVHVYGMPCYVDKIQEIADKYHLKVIYDAAHAFGVKRNNVSIGNFGDASVYSFHATKVFNTIEGGAVAFANAQLGEILYDLKNFGIRSEEEVAYVGANAKMNEFAAAMGLCNLERIETSLHCRKKVAEIYYEKLGNKQGIKLIYPKKDVQWNYAYFPVVFNQDEFGYSRDEVYERLKENNIFARKYFYPIIPNYQCYNEQYSSCKVPVAEQISKQILTLPIYESLSSEDVVRVCDIILNM
ncbi:MAG: DegT/DnrJ/EryC1/StrS family aminotransferase [Lachnospiraceae bacterium]